MATSVNDGTTPGATDGGSGHPLLGGGPGPVLNPPHGGKGGHGGGGGDGNGNGDGDGTGDGGDTSSVCDQLAGIIKTICSMSTLLHKVVDACYPPSSWPTSSYPDGCGSVGDCGCGGNGKGNNPATVTGPGPVLGQGTPPATQQGTPPAIGQGTTPAA